MIPPEKQKNVLAQLHGRVAFWMREAEEKRDKFFRLGETEQWKYWKGKAEAFKRVERNLYNPSQAE